MTGRESLFDGPRHELLVARIIARAEHWEKDSRDAEDAANTYRGKDEEAAVDLFRQAARSLSRARDLRGLLSEGE